MDREDQEHFRTIATALPPQRTGFKSASETAASSSCRHDPVWTLQRAKMILGCYRRDEATDPDMFASALAMIFQDYPRDIVEYVTDPRTGVINKFPMGLPQVPQIRECLEQAMNDRAHRARYAALPRYRENRDALPKPEREVLFVADIISGYEKMWQKHNDTQGKFSRAETRLCDFDQQRHAGLWVPSDWWLQRNVEQRA